MTTLVRHKTVVDALVEIDSPQWQKWLGQAKSFRYECEHGAVTLIKDGKYWTASKKFDGRLRRKRAGTDSDLNLERLRALTALLCLNGCWNEYLKEKNVAERETKKGLKRRIAYLEKKNADYQKIIADLEAKLVRVSQKRV